MGTAPDLYLWPANDLDKYIFDYLQPNEEFLCQVRAAVDTICAFLKENCYRGHPSKTRVLKVVKGGSSAKGTALRSGSDADLVVFLSCIQSYSHQESKRKEIIEEIHKNLKQCQSKKTFEVIFEQTKWDNPRVLSFRLRSKRVADFIDFDVLPAYDALGQLTTGYRPDPEIYVNLIKNWSPGQNFSTCFTELQRDFIISRPTKVKCLIRLVKHWYKTKLNGDKLPPKYALELVSIYAWENGSEGRERFNMAQAFRNFLELICNYQDLCIYWTVNYNFENTELATFLRMQLAKPRPVILDPADPTGNFGEGYKWEHVAREAEICLSRMSNKTSTGPGCLRDLPPASPIQLSVKTISGSVLTMTVSPYVTVSQVKEEIQHRWNISTNEQRLCLQGMNPSHGLLQNGQTLADYGVFYDSTINLLEVTSQAMQIFLRNIDGKTYTYQVRPDSTVRELKIKIEEHLKVAVAQQRLTYSDRELEDRYTLAHYQIQSESTVFLLLRLRGGATIQQENGRQPE